MATTKLTPSKKTPRRRQPAAQETTPAFDGLKARVVDDLKQNKIQPLASASGFTQPDRGNLDSILSQRYKQRDRLFRFSIRFSGFSFVGLAVMLLAQAMYKAATHGQELFGTLELETVALGVFIQFLGLLKIITDSLWNDKPYLDSGSLKSKN
jgi:hypothetical protein